MCLIDVHRLSARGIVVLLIVGTFLLISCSSTGPTVPTGQDLTRPTEISEDSASRWIWGNWTMQIPSDHSSIEVVPVRSADKHFNVKMLLEQTPCDNCLWVSKFQNNGDGTISIDITIRHPYPTNDYFTGFDVRGIVYTSTSYTVMPPDEPDFWNYYHIPALETGDLEVLNPDGYTSAFSPFMNNPHQYPPICKYQEGGDLGGTFDEDDEQFLYDNEFWPYKCYYSSEERRYFAANAVLTQTYNIALPPGEWEFGYSVDACWAPPTNVPVTDVVADFPPQANTLLHYRVEMEISGPLVGLTPSTMFIRLYHHIPEIHNLYTLTDVNLYTNCVEDHEHLTHPDGPTFICDEYVEFAYDLVNELQRPPGKYPVLASCYLADNDYLDQFEEHWWENARCNQVLWVTVAE